MNILNTYIRIMFSASRGTYKLHILFKQTAYAGERLRMKVETGRAGRAPEFQPTNGLGGRVNITA